MKKGLKNIVKKGFVGILASSVIPISAMFSMGCGSPNKDSNNYKIEKPEVCLTIPQISPILDQDIIMGDSISVPVDIQNLNNGDKVYLNGPAGMSLNNTENGLEIKWKPCGDSKQDFTTQAIIEIENKCKEGDSQTFNVSVLPKIESLYIKQVSPDVNLQFGDTARIPLELISQEPLDISLSNNPIWATLDNKEVSLTPYSAYDDYMNINVTKDGCYIETQKIKLNVPPVTIDGSLYDYLRKLDIKDLDNPENKEDWYYLRRQVGYGLTDQELDNKKIDLESAISTNYTLIKDSSVAQWNRPTYIELKESEKCPSIGPIAYYKLLNGGIICIINTINVKRNSAHEDNHSRLCGRIPNTDVLGGKGMVQEPFAYAIAEVVNKNLTSFSEISKNEYYGYVDFINDLYIKYGFDVKDLPSFFNLLDQKTNNGAKVLQLKEYKCALDTFFNDDTSPIYCRSFTCSTDPQYYNIYNISRIYCGD